MGGRKGRKDRKEKAMVWWMGAGLALLVAVA